MVQYLKLVNKFQCFIEPIVSLPLTRNRLIDQPHVSQLKQHTLLLFSKMFFNIILVSIHKFPKCPRPLSFEIDVIFPAHIMILHLITLWISVEM